MDKRAIKDIPLSDRPREKLEKHGSSKLENKELLAIILRTGTKSASAIDIADKILREKGLPYLAQADVFELQTIHGLGIAKATQIKAALELGMRVRNFTQDKTQIKEPADAAILLKDEMQFLPKEEFRVIMLNTKNMVINTETISIGTANASLAVPREIFQKAIINKTVTAVIFVHNHPSGDPTPSSEDIAITKRIYEAGKIIGIDVLDHIIIGQGKGNDYFYSMKEKSLL